MPNSSSPATAETEELEEVEFDADDFGIIISPDGTLKMLMFPDHLMEDLPEEIKEILKIFGIDDYYQLENRILH